jgi:lipopolysaccharide biosynthesis glycosyltransferase
MPPLATRISLFLIRHIVMKTNSQSLAVAVAGDDAYAAPMAVTVRSLLDTLAPAWRLELFVVDGGLCTDNRRRLAESWGDDARVHWIVPDVGRVARLPVSDHASTSAYLRLLLPKLLPDAIDRVLYLDSDLLVRRDVGQLWKVPHAGAPVVAVQDYGMPWFDAARVSRDFALQRKYLVSARPVANYAELGLRGEAPYFNSGVMVMDLAAWRREGLSEACLACVEQNREHLYLWDQYALNVVLADRWSEADPRWNFNAQLRKTPSWRHSGLRRNNYGLAMQDPWIVHYCSAKKPWHYFCDHPYRDDYFTTLDRTAWRGWRPQPPADVVRQTIKFAAKRVESGVKTRVRRLAWELTSGLRRGA